MVACDAAARFSQISEIDNNMLAYCLFKVVKKKTSDSCAFRWAQIVTLNVSEPSDYEYQISKTVLDIQKDK